MTGMDTRTKPWAPRRTPRLRGAVVALAGAAALVAASGTSGVAAAAEPQPRLVLHELPDPATVLGSAKPDAKTTWVAGAKVIDGSLVPVVYAQDLRRGPGWTELPTVPGADGRFNDVDAPSPRDGWVVGDGTAVFDPDAPPPVVTTQHWDGRKWKEHPFTLQKGAQSGGLLSVSARTPSDAWAAGFVDIVDRVIEDPEGGPPQYETHWEGVISHWNGKKWRQVPIPRNHAGNWVLNSIDVAGPDDVWAVGVAYEDFQPIVMHYDGRTWTEMPRPPVKAEGAMLNGVTAKDARDVWVVGRADNDSTGERRGLIMHWDGRTWTEVAAPPQARNLNNVDIAPGGVVAVGIGRDAQGFEAATVVRVTDGKASALDLPPLGRTSSAWNVGVAYGQVTAVGMYTTADSQAHGLVLTGRV